MSTRDNAWMADRASERENRELYAAAIDSYCAAQAEIHAIEEDERKRIAAIPMDAPYLLDDLGPDFDELAVPCLREDYGPGMDYHAKGDFR